jgi:hypothetical protein
MPIPACTDSSASLAVAFGGFLFPVIHAIVGIRVFDPILEIIAQSKLAGHRLSIAKTTYDLKHIGPAREGNPVGSLEGVNGLQEHELFTAELAFFG